MNEDQVKSLVRWAVTALCGWAVTKGWIDQDLTQAVVAVAIAMAALVWAILTHNRENTLKAAARVDPELKVIVPEHVIANNPGVERLVKDTTVPNVTAAPKPS